MTFAAAYKQQQYARRKKLVASVKISSGCVDCGLWGPDHVLSFDHVRGKKEFGIGQRWDVSMSRLEAEIAKCEVVCHNCHALRTAKRLKETGGPTFEPFPKTPRLFRDMVVTEKLDGTNGTIWVDGDGDVWAGSKNRWLTVEQDNFGFAAWVEANAAGLADTLGEGAHRGEWWGSGIQRGYGLQKGEKRFSLFNVKRYLPLLEIAAAGDSRPYELNVVPTLYVGEFTTDHVRWALSDLAALGSKASPGFMKPEGIVVYHSAANSVFKVTIEGDEKPKSVAR